MNRNQNQTLKLATSQLEMSKKKNPESVKCNTNLASRRRHFNFILAFFFFKHVIMAEPLSLKQLAFTKVSSMFSNALVHLSTSPSEPASTQHVRDYFEENLPVVVLKWFR